MAKNNHLLIQSDVNKDEQLISLVEQNPVLYTQTHPKYMDSKYKQKVWETIGAFVEEDTLACKARWYNIRDNYRKSLRNNLTRSGSKKAKLYKYTTQLSFLSNYADEVIREHATINIDDQETRSTLPSPTRAPTPPPAEESVEEPTQDSEHEEFLDDIVMKHETNYSENEFTKDPLNTSKPAMPSTVKTAIDNASVSGPQTRIIRRIRRPMLEHSESESSERVLDLLVRKMLTTAENRDPVDAFLAGIAPTLKSLHPYYQNLARSEIFATVQKYELKMLTEPPPLCNSNQRSGT
ncbi:AAEL006871-PA [Aedes aegypti]|uniref:AAEL006871-PA n=2 Tax=Aedes aegypti TaxID=7159 RepID=A0A1S4FEW4_AEDAE|nr:uncharacterized protein LOC5568446 [Aedes aegypti]EAT41492.1 AAEL006871-PA [Aedes aegypti]